MTARNNKKVTVYRARNKADADTWLAALLALYDAESVVPTPARLLQ